MAAGVVPVARPAKDEQFFTESLRSMPDEFMDCRDLRHSWVKVKGYTTIDGTDVKKTYVSRELQCLRCGCVRTDVINVRTFDRVSSSYMYQEGYTVKGAGVGNRAALVRREVYRRAH